LENSESGRKLKSPRAKQVAVTVPGAIVQNLMLYEQENQSDAKGQKTEGSELVGENMGRVRMIQAMIEATVLQSPDAVPRNMSESSTRMQHGGGPIPTRCFRRLFGGRAGQDRLTDVARRCSLPGRSSRRYPLRSAELKVGHTSTHTHPYTPRTMDMPIANVYA
jgi:hypothetical protein